MKEDNVIGIMMLIFIVAITVSALNGWWIY